MYSDAARCSRAAVMRLRALRYGEHTAVRGEPGECRRIWTVRYAESQPDLQAVRRKALMEAFLSAERKRLGHDRLFRNGQKRVIWEMPARLFGSGCELMRGSFETVMIRKIKRHEINEDDTGSLRKTIPGRCSSEHSGGAFLLPAEGKRCMNAAFVLAVLHKDCFKQASAAQELRYACGVV